MSTSPASKRQKVVADLSLETTNIVDSDDEVQVIDPPVKLSTVAVKPVSPDDDKQGNDEDVECVGVLNKQEDLPHMRPHCTRYPYTREEIPAADPSNQRYCPLCYCYVCDVPVKECQEWQSHCQATDQSEYWSHKRTRQAAEAFHAWFPNAKVFRHAFIVMRHLLHVCRVDFQTDGIRVRGADKTYVCFLDIFLSATDFDEYNCPKDIHLGIEPPRILQFLALYFGKCRRKDRLILDLMEGFMQFELENDDNKEIPSPIKVKMTDPTANYPSEFNSFEHTCCVHISTTHFKPVLDFFCCHDYKTLELTSDASTKTVTFEGHNPRAPARKARFHFRSSVGRKDKKKIKVVCSETFTITLISEPFGALLKAIPLSAVVEIHLGPSCPSKFVFLIDGKSGCSGESKLTVYVRPKEYEDF